jgi:hypothetical protein
MKVFCSILAAVAVLGIGIVLAAGDPPSVSEKTAGSAFIFEGIVKELKKSNVKEVEASDRTLVATVNAVRKSSESLGNVNGQDVTVVLQKPLTDYAFKVGDHAVFFTEGVALGEHLAVEETFPADRVTPAMVKSAATVKSDMKAALKAIGSQITAQVKDHVEEQLKEHLEKADLVIYGKVSKVQQVNPKTLAGGAAGKAKRRPISEHVADWHVADVDVQSVEKGDDHKKVQIYFANSRDVAFRNMPRFEPNQEGTFILHTDQPGSEPVKHLITAAAADANQIKSFTALSPLDFQPKLPNHENLEKVRRLLGK